MNPRPENKPFYTNIEHRVKNDSVGDLEYIVYPGDPFGFYPSDEKIEQTVIGVSGYQGPPMTSPNPSGYVYMARSYRDDAEDGHLNISDRFYWKDNQGNAWSNYDRDIEDHLQEYIDGSGLGDLQRYNSVPPGNRGHIRDLKDAHFDSSTAPYK